MSLDAISFEDFIMDVGQNHSRTTALSMEIFYLVRNVFFYIFIGSILDSPSQW